MAEYISKFNTSEGAKQVDYNALGNLPTIPSKTSDLNNDSNFISSPATAEVGQVLEVEAVDETGKPTSWKVVNMPESLPNPHALTFTGAISESYDGSEAKTIEIPSMSGGSGDESTMEVVQTLLASGTIASGTKALALTDTGITYDDFIKHKFVKVTLKSTSNFILEYSFRDLPTATWNFNSIGTGSNTGHYTVFEPVGKLLRIAEICSSGYSILGDNGFFINNYNIGTPNSNKMTYRAFHSYCGTSTFKLASMSDLTTDVNWYIYALD